MCICKKESDVDDSIQAAVGLEAATAKENEEGAQGIRRQGHRIIEQQPIRWADTSGSDICPSGDKGHVDTDYTGNISKETRCAGIELTWLSDQTKGGDGNDL